MGVSLSSSASPPAAGEMFSNKRPNYSKLRTNLRLCVNRLKLLEKKKTEIALKARREISDYIKNGKNDRARIRVEQIIREDYLVEAMEIIEMFCDLLITRFGLIEKMKEIDPGLEETIATIIWVTPRLASDVQELREVSHQLGLKYGKEFVLACQSNKLENVNDKVLHRLSTRPPPRRLVEQYLVEIAKSYNVEFEPDPLLTDDTECPPPPNLIDFDLGDPKNPNNYNGGGSSGGGNTGGGTKLYDNPVYDNPPAVPARSDSYQPGPSYPPPAGAYQPKGANSQYPPPGGFHYMSAGPFQPPPTHFSPSAPAGGHSMFTSKQAEANEYLEILPGDDDPPPGYYPPNGQADALPEMHGATSYPPPLPSRPPAAAGSASAPAKPARTFVHDDRLPSYDELHGPEANNASLFDNMQFPPGASGPSTLPVPPRPAEQDDSFGLPSVPSESVATSGENIDFDELTRRFENLKKK